jgi:hypothetical protein
MLALFSQVPRENRPAFIGFLLSRISEHSGYADTKPPDLRLTAEFCPRAGYKKELIRAIGESELTQGLVSVLTQLEDTIALNFNLFSDEDLTQLAGILPPLKTRSHEYNVRVQFPSPLPDP